MRRSLAVTQTFGMREPSVRLITPESLRAGLKEIRRRRRSHWIAFLALLPGVVFLIRFFSESPLSWLALAWLLAFAATTHYALASRCPRCGQPFGSRPGEGHNPSTQHCLRCGLPLRATESELREILSPHDDSGPVPRGLLRLLPCRHRTRGIGTAMLVLGGLGAGIGALIGSVSHAERWVEVPAPWVAIRPAPAGRLRIAITLPPWP